MLLLGKIDVISLYFNNCCCLLLILILAAVDSDVTYRFPSLQSLYVLCVFVCLYMCILCVGLIIFEKRKSLNLSVFLDF